MVALRNGVRCVAHSVRDATPEDHDVWCVWCHLGMPHKVVFPLHPARAPPNLPAPHVGPYLGGHRDAPWTKPLRPHVGRALVGSSSSGLAFSLSGNLVAEETVEGEKDPTTQSGVLDKPDTPGPTILKYDYAGMLRKTILEQTMEALHNKLKQDYAGMLNNHVLDTLLDALSPGCAGTAGTNRWLLKPTKSQTADLRLLNGYGKPPTRCPPAPPREPMFNK